MFALFICGLILSAVPDVVYGKYQPITNGWLAPHKVVATWDQAYQQCEREGAVLASPITEDLRNDMQSIANNTLYFIGTKAKYMDQDFISAEGVWLDNMPVSDIIEKLDPEDGKCLAMTSDSISVVSCSFRLPYMCYKKQTKAIKLNECGTFDNGYQLVKSTDSCYKFHNNLTIWGDAYTICRAEGGSLAIINGESEAQMLVDDIINVKSHYVLIGFEDWNGTGKWKSIFGEPIDKLYNKWVSGSKPIQSKSCATLDPDTAELKAFSSCLTTKFYFLCEKQPDFILFPNMEQWDLNIE